MKTTNTPLNLAQALATQRMATQKGSGQLSTEAMDSQLNLACDTGVTRLGFWNRLRSRNHRSDEALKTTKQLITCREETLRKVGMEAIAAEVELMRAALRQRFATEFAVLAERGMAAYAAAQSNFFAVVDAGSDFIHEGLYQRVQELTDRHQAGRLADATYQSELIRAHQQAQLQISALEASCAQRIADLNKAFHNA